MINKDMKTITLDEYTVGQFSEDKDSRRLTIRASSETPVNRGWYQMLVLHNKESADLEFANSGRCPLLVDHQNSVEKQIGVIENAKIDVKTKSLNVNVKLMKDSPLANHVYEGWKEGIISNVSIGFRVLEEEVENNDDDDEQPIIIVKKFELLELSVCSVPAIRKDAHIIDEHKQTQKETKTMSTTKDKVQTLDEKTEATPTAPVQKAAERVEIKQDFTEANERKRITEILSIAEQTNIDVKSFVTDGTSVDDVRKAALAEMVKNSESQNVKPQGSIDWSQKEAGQYSLGKHIRAALTGDYSEAGFEQEVNKHLAQEMNRSTTPGTILVPNEAISKFAITAGGAGTGAELVGNEYRPDLFVGALYNNSVLKQAGATVIPATQNFSLAKMGGATFNYRGETDSATESTPATSLATFSPKVADGMIKTSELAIVQTDPASEALIAKNLLEGIGSFADAGGISGDGIGDSVTGILHQNGVGVVSLGTNGGEVAFANLRDMIKTVRVTNNVGNRWITNNSVVYKLTTTPKVAGTDSVMIMQDDDRLLNYELLTTENVPSDLAKGTGTNLSAAVYGDFSNVVIAEFGATELRVSNSHEDDFAKGLVSLRVTIFFDIGMLRGDAFAICKDIITV